MKINEGMDHIAKYISYGDDLYFPSIVKNEWNGHDNAWWAFYGKRTKYGYSSRVTLFTVCGRSYEDVSRKLIKLYFNYEAEGFIRDGKTWHGPKPHGYDFSQSVCDHSILE
jgi:hypothetical protein